MSKLLIRGGMPLHGEVEISAAKNSVLPILAASLLLNETVLIKNIPHLQDVTTALDLLGQLGVKFSLNEAMQLEINAANVHSFRAPYELVRTMRASILVLGPLLTRFGYAEVSLPGGCAIGQRPVNLHLKGLEAMGAEIRVENGYIYARAPANGLQGAHIVFDNITVTGTENLMMAAVLARGTTVLENVAKEPEVQDLAKFLNSMGAHIEGTGSDRIEIEGVERLHGGAFQVIPDRIEAGTYLLAAAITNGKITVKNMLSLHLDAVLAKLDEAGASLVIQENSVTLDMRDRQLKAVNLQTSPFPGIPTDMQAQFCLLNVVAEGTSIIKETVFENRFMHIQELVRMGADITVNGNTVVIVGKKQLMGTQVMATDLRASASLVLAGLVASGETVIDRIYHIDRGYEHIEEKLKRLKADITRIS
jgi:UDP-N-acetylglucosamine 1-carboxyvinyltransferase